MSRDFSLIFFLFYGRVDFLGWVVDCSRGDVLYFVFSVFGGGGGNNCYRWVSRFWFRVEFSI